MIRPMYCLVEACASEKGQCRNLEPNEDGIIINCNIRPQRKSQSTEQYPLSARVFALGSITTNRHLNVMSPPNKLHACLCKH
jgi:hypothetical protein